MKDFYIVSAITGRFLRCGQIAEADVESQCGEGELLFEGKWPDGCDRINLVTKEAILTLVNEDESRERLTMTVKARRNDLLRLSDWTQLADVALTSEQVTEWAEYRQSLRDISSQAGYPETIEWPQPPA